MQPMYINRSALAIRWNMSVSTLKRWERLGLLRPIRFPTGTVRFRLREVEKIEAERGVCDV